MRCFALACFACLERSICCAVATRGRPRCMFWRETATGTGRVRRVLDSSGRSGLPCFIFREFPPPLYLGGLLSSGGFKGSLPSLTPGKAGPPPHTRPELPLFTEKGGPSLTPSPSSLSLAGEGGPYLPSAPAPSLPLDPSSLSFTRPELPLFHSGRSSLYATRKADPAPLGKELPLCLTTANPEFSWGSGGLPPASQRKKRKSTQAPSICISSEVPLLPDPSSLSNTRQGGPSRHPGPELPLSY